jgi:hypothetical protein
MTKQVLIDEDKLKMVWAALKSYQGFIDDAHIIEGQWHWLNGTKEAIKALEEALAKQEQGEPVAWTPDRSGKYLTVVYRDVVPGDEVGALVEHPKCVIMSWSNAVHDVDYLRNRIPPQRNPLEIQEVKRISATIRWADDQCEVDFARAIEAAHGIKE